MKLRPRVTAVLKQHRFAEFLGKHDGPADSRPRRGRRTTPPRLRAPPPVGRRYAYDRSSRTDVICWTCATAAGPNFCSIM
jgi:hypothetical protein